MKHSFNKLPVQLNELTVAICDRKCAIIRDRHIAVFREGFL